MSKLKALVISHSNIAEDPRILRHISVISEKFEVHTVGYGEKPPTSEKHYRVPDDVRFLPRNLGKLINMQIGLSITVSKSSDFTETILNLVRSDNVKYELLQINDVHALAAGFELKANSKVWVDMHEYAPLEGEHDWRWNVAFSGYVRKICNEYLPRADSLSTVSGSISSRYSLEFNKHVYLIRNSHPFVPRPDSLPSNSDTVNFVHAGVALKARNIENMIVAFSNLGEKHQLYLMLVPTESSYYRTLQDMSESITNVNIVSPVPNAEVVSKLASFDAGIVTIPPTSYNYRHCLPNKFFQFVQARLPIVAGPLPEISKLVIENNLGWVTQTFDARSISETISKIDRNAIREHHAALDVGAIKLSASVDDKVRREVIASMFR